MKDIQIFSDFDGTITKEDTLNKFLRTYASESWLDLEQKWIRGEVGSRECISEQMRLFPNMTQEVLDEFIDSIEIDESFVSFYDHVKSSGIDFCVVSDGFDYFIKRILFKYGIKDAKLYSNHLEFEDGKFNVSFPYSSEKCKRKSGVCKCSVVSENTKRNTIVTKRVIYAGDGISDFCVSDKVDILFAKGDLLEYCKNTQKGECGSFGSSRPTVIEFCSFAEIEKYIKQI